jgi:triacylglycerol lipase
VLLVPGWSDEAHHLEPLRARFVAAGWPDSAVVALSFEDPVGSNRSHARDVRRAVARLQMGTGAERVDVVAHSMGGLAVRYYLQSGGADEVRRIVFLATPHRGTYAAYVAWGDGGREMAPGSDFLLSLNRRLLPLPEGVEGITVRTPVDLHILPPESAALPPLPDIEVCCPTHAGLVDHEETFHVIESFLTRPP